MSQLVNVTAGAVEYVGAVLTETTGKDISGDTFDIGLGGWAPSTPPDTWAAEPVVEASGSIATVKMLIDSGTAVGSYSLWVRAHDTPEVVPLNVGRVDVE